MKKENSNLKRNIVLVFFICLMLYPTIANRWNAFRNEQLATKYNQMVESVDKEELDEAIKAAQEFNSKHTHNYIEEIVKGDKTGYDKNSEYAQLLNLNDEGVMGYIRIPKIGSKLSIYHGCGEKALSEGCGHVEGTSLPVGGEGTHAVLSAHRGLAQAKLFTDLDQMEIGDKFYIHVFKEVLVYEVTDIFDMVDPDDTSELEIKENKDYVTLLTCTPYAVNTHRLLVRGERVTEVADEVIETPTVVDSIQNMNIQEIISLAGVLLIVLILFVQNKREKAEKLANESQAEKSVNENQ